MSDDEDAANAKKNEEIRRCYHDVYWRADDAALEDYPRRLVCLKCGCRFAVQPSPASNVAEPGCF